MRPTSAPGASPRTHLRRARTSARHVEFGGLVRQPQIRSPEAVRSDSIALARGDIGTTSAQQSHVTAKAVASELRSLMTRLPARGGIALTSHGCQRDRCLFGAPSTAGPWPAVQVRKYMLPPCLVLSCCPAFGEQSREGEGGRREQVSEQRRRPPHVLRGARRALA